MRRRMRGTVAQDRCQTKTGTPACRQRAGRPTARRPPDTPSRSRSSCRPCSSRRAPRRAGPDDRGDRDLRQLKRLAPGTRRASARPPRRGVADRDLRVRADAPAGRRGRGRAPTPGRPAAVDALEGLEDPLSLGLRDAGPVVLDLDLGAGSVDRRARRVTRIAARPGGPWAGGVLDEVVDHDPQARLPAPIGDRVVGPQSAVSVAVGVARRGGGAHAGIDELGEVDVPRARAGAASPRRASACRLSRSSTRRRCSGEARRRRARCAARPGSRGGGAIVDKRRLDARERRPELVGRRRRRSDGSRRGARFAVVSRTPEAAGGIALKLPATTRSSDGPADRDRALEVALGLECPPSAARSRLSGPQHEVRREPHARGPPRRAPPRRSVRAGGASAVRRSSRSARLVVTSRRTRPPQARIAERLRVGAVALITGRHRMEADRRASMLRQAPTPESSRDRVADRQAPASCASRAGRRRGGGRRRAGPAAPRVTAGRRARARRCVAAGRRAPGARSGRRRARRSRRPRRGPPRGRW